MATNEAVAEPLEQPPPLQQQRAGERNLPAGPPPPAAAPAPGVPAAPSPLPSLEQHAATAQERADLLAKDFTSGMAKADELYNTAMEEMRAFQARRAEQMQPFRDKQLALLNQPRPAIPEPPTEPPVPNTGARPFLEGLPGESTTATLQKMLTGLSLIAQMGVGIGKGYANGALAAYSGALQGWQAGDKQRAENEWNQYLQQVGSMQREYKNRRRAYDDIVEANKWDLQKTQLELGMKAAELGEERETIEMGFKNHDAFVKRLQLSGTMLHKLQEDASRATMQVLMQRQKEAADLREMIYREEAKDERARLARENAVNLAGMRQELKLATSDQELVQAPRGGAYFDQKNGRFLTAVPRGALRQDQANFVSLNNQDTRFLAHAKREQEMLDRLAVLAPKVLQKYSVQNLVHEWDLKLQGKISSNPDLREYVNLAEDANIALTRVLGDQAPRVTMLQILRKHVGARMGDTTPVALRAINAIRTTVENARESRLYPNDQLTKHRHIPARSEQTNWIVWDNKAPKGKERKEVEFEPGEAVPDHIELIEVVK